jgi:hypothetical protein
MLFMLNWRLFALGNKTFVSNKKADERGLIFYTVEYQEAIKLSIDPLANR